MEPFIPALVVFTVGMVAGATVWHFVHARVKQAYVVAQNDIAWLKAEVARLQPAAAPVVAPVAPAPVAAPAPAPAV